MKTEHRVIFEDACRMAALSDSSVDLVVTSPPYPMIEMWDRMFREADPSIGPALEKGEGMEVFEAMHRKLDLVWDELFRVLKKGGFACINIGDATRTLNGDFRLYPNHARILQHLLKIGFSALPDILWRKQTNAPNKFMGSGMLPAGAYVTLEHEYILIVRKGGKRVFKTDEEKKNRHASAVFWEERNVFFSDVWFDIKGTVQGLWGGESRSRSGAYPFELAYRLINMYSVKGDTVLDPFLGTGTTMAAAMTAARNSIGFEIDETLAESIFAVKENIVEFSNRRMEERLERHSAFVKDRVAAKGPMKHANANYGFPVITAQEKQLLFNSLTEVFHAGEHTLAVSYAGTPTLTASCENHALDDLSDTSNHIATSAKAKGQPKVARKKKKQSVTGKPEAVESPEGGSDKKGSRASQMELF